MRGKQVESIHLSSAEAICPDGEAAYAADFAASPRYQLGRPALSGSRVGFPLIYPYQAGKRVKIASKGDSCCFGSARDVILHPSRLSSLGALSSYPKGGACPNCPGVKAGFDDAETAARLVLTGSPDFPPNL